ncbi:MAG TPA: BamA/TamA family outer membrane protein [Polyangiaceae bacterium]|jgi:outer membrane protein assembly factor BamA|nr:MAG: Outer membrane protein assembly factor BamA [Deltaproteobacteria bacterium ADurb.Bin207]HNZ25187.1 BamA/TamA family outer membrane protein [Polyangiaceae bacterium]HOE50635.1 BamA/TamA family outer membrane protein [Polyangiaceae bacterium]HOT10531.1 BamA/TamA family outer membrane protein [Polyangiaceae bacterium]HQB46168.1 BamA/TamA family outer membrane protein [Polyangiaceae bacterium]
MIVATLASAQEPEGTDVPEDTAEGTAETSVPAEPKAEPESQETPLNSNGSDSSGASSSTPSATLRPSKQEPCPACENAGALGYDDSVHLRYELERIVVRGNARTRERIILRYVKLRAGDIVDVDQPEWELLRYRLLGTGFFQRVSLSLRKGSQRGKVILIIDVVERNTVVVSDLWMGLSADADTEGNARPLTAYAGADLAETNLGGTGITLGAGMGFAQDQLALRTRFFDPSVMGSTWMATASLLYNDALEFYGNRDVLYDDPSNAIEKVRNHAVVQYQRFGGLVGVGWDLSAAWQAWVDYRLERLDATLPLAASHRRGLDTEPIDFGLHRGLSVLSTVRSTLQYDTRDSPILPTRGSHTTFMAEASLTPMGSDYPFQRYTLSTSKWFSLPWAHVIRVGVFGGAVVGEAPIFERFYVGDFSDLLPSRMLGLNVDRRPPPNFLGTSIVEVRYGDYATKVLGEYRIPLYRGSSAVYGIDFFGAGGVYAVASERDLRDPPRGYSGLARIPVDLTFNLGLQIDTNAGGFTFAFSNILGFIPVRSEATP